MIGLEPLKVRWVARRAYKQREKKILPEIFVGTTTANEAWARDNGLNRIKIYPINQGARGRELKDVDIQWLENFHHELNPAIADDKLDTVKLYVLGLLQSELAKAATEMPLELGEKGKAVVQKEKVAPKKRKRGALGMRKKKQTKLGSENDIDDQAHETDDAGVNDHEVVQRYMDSIDVPDKKTAAGIGRAKGRIALDGRPIPAEVIIEMKETAIKAHISPFFAWEYGAFVRTLPTPQVPQRPIPSTYDPSPPKTPSPDEIAITSETPQSLSTAEQKRLEDEEGSDQAFWERYEESKRIIERWPTLEEGMAVYEGLPELTVNEKEAVGDTAHLS